MNDQSKTITGNPDSHKCVPTRKIYCEPKLAVFGRVSDLTRGGAFSPSRDANTSRMGASDPQLKENVRKVGRHPGGFGLYLFDYKPEYRERFGHSTQFGVMANEVESVVPEAVSIHPEGYKMVNYAMLGITRTL